MDITLHISDSVAQALHQRAPTNDESNEILNIAHKFGVVIHAMHPGIEDAYLMKDFYVEVENLDEVESVTEAFLRCSAVEGAYAKPEGEPP